MNPDVKIDGSESSLTGPLRRAMNAALINVMDLKVNGNPEKIPLAEILGNMDALASALHAADPGRERGPCGSYPGTALHVEALKMLKEIYVSAPQTTRWEIEHAIDYLSGSATDS